jgi:hypothetical protein
MDQLPSNVIPDGETLFRFCNPAAFPEGQREIPISVFNDPRLSCDWQRYRPDPRTSFHIDEGKTRVISITVTDAIRNPRNPKREGQIVEAWKQDIHHCPVSAEDDPVHGANNAHSLIEGRKKPAVMDALVDASHWWDVVAPDDA